MNCAVTHLPDVVFIRTPPHGNDITEINRANERGFAPQEHVVN